MQILPALLRNTPWWAYLLLALVIWSGLRALAPRTVPLWRAAIVPLAFIGWGLASLLTRADAAAVAAHWLAGAAARAAAAWITAGAPGLEIDATRRLMTFPASRGPLVRNGLIFAIKYATGVAMVLAPGVRDELRIFDAALSGAMGGYFAGGLARLARAYRRAAAPPVS